MRRGGGFSGSDLGKLQGRKMNGKLFITLEFTIYKPTALVSEESLLVLKQDSYSLTFGGGVIKKYKFGRCWSHVARAGEKRMHSE